MLHSMYVCMYIMLEIHLLREKAVVQMNGLEKLRSSALGKKAKEILLSFFLFYFLSAEKVVVFWELLSLCYKNNFVTFNFSFLLDVDWLCLLDALFALLVIPLLQETTRELDHNCFILIKASILKVSTFRKKIMKFIIIIGTKWNVFQLLLTRF